MICLAAFPYAKRCCTLAPRFEFSVENSLSNSYPHAPADPTSSSSIYSRDLTIEHSLSLQWKPKWRETHAALARLSFPPTSDSISSSVRSFVSGTFKAKKIVAIIPKPAYNQNVPAFPIPLTSERKK